MEQSNITVPIHGNYHGYYNKRQANRDLRLSLLPKDIFLDKRVLDIGCNEGLVSCEVAQSWGARETIGVDIDDFLIRAAWRRRRSLWSRQQPTQPVADERSSELSKGQNNDLEARSPYDYFPEAFEHIFGPLPITSVQDDSPSRHRFPHNVSFRTSDWLKDGTVEDRHGYDVILAFSITKWIHLNNGDDGIKTFFSKIFTTLRPGGVFILEPQEWTSYAKTKRMNPILKEKGKNLQLRPDDFSLILKEIGFVDEESLGESGEGGFRRPIVLYRKSSGCSNRAPVRGFPSPSIAKNSPGV
ncbi:Bin3-domain-containing protein [Schizopora paradoxa]|uniref:RNA methyltransferase n=1 Tax=Schizopora paradoxa TaxID=27342 RepID=A0A0H2R300_9AGAM|nr:Bin3-domain-containing protein [Schizopora paradoxa]